MISKIKQFFKDNLLLDAGADRARDEYSLKLACAALLIEVSKADFTLDPAEKQRITKTLQQSFELSQNELDSLIELAEEEAEQSTSLYQFTRLINDSYSYQQKIRLIDSMWQVAFADGNIDRYEEHLIRKIADLIYVSHTDYISLKLAARARFS